MKKKIIYWWIWLVVLIWAWIWFFLLKHKNQAEPWKEDTTTKVTKETVVKDWTIELWDRKITIWQLWNIDEESVVDIAKKAKEEELKVNTEIEKRKTEKWIQEWEEIPEEIKKDLTYYYNKEDKWTLEMEKWLFYSISETDSFMNPEWFILDEDWNKIFLTPETDEDGKEIQKERKDFKWSMYAKECVYMKNPLITKDNKETEINKYLTQFKNDLKFFKWEAPKFQLSWWLEYLVIQLWKYEKQMKEIEKWLKEPFLNKYDWNKPFKNQEIQFENKIKEMIQTRKDICEVMFNFPIDQEAPKRDITWSITIIEPKKEEPKKSNTSKNTQNQSKKNKKKPNQSKNTSNTTKQPSNTSKNNNKPSNTQSNTPKKQENTKK